MATRRIVLRARPAPLSENNSEVLHREFDTARAGVVVCDMWDAHHCISAARRVADMAPRMNDVLAKMREDGALIVHAPSDCTDFYRGTAARNRAADAPHVEALLAIGWNDWEPDELQTLPATLTDPGPCSCDSPEPCNEGFRAWTRQTPLIDIRPNDVVTDDGQELFNALEQRGIEDVVVMGVHTNICVLGRSFGIRQLVYFGKRPVLCRDLTDAFHRDPHGHSWGTEQVIAHIERRWCPSVTSDQFLPGD